MSDEPVNPISVRPRPRLARALLTLVCAGVLVGGAVWLQKALWPKRELPRDARAMNERLFPVQTPFDWASPPLPQGTKVNFRLEKGTADKGDRRLQLFCACALPPERIRAFYEAELAAAGWKKYNDSLAGTTGTALPDGGIPGGLYRMGNLSLAIHIFPGKAGGEFRLSVVTIPAQ